MVRKLQELDAKHGGDLNLSFFTTAKRPRVNVFSSGRLTKLPGEYGYDYYFVRAAEVDLRGLLRTAVIGCSGTVRIRGHSSGAVFAAGPVNIEHLLYNSIIVSDGDVRLEGAANSLVIARGTVTCAGRGCHACRLIAGKTVKVGRYARLIDCKVTEHATNPLGFVKFFDPAAQGVTVEPAKSGVRVNKVVPASPFAKAGLAAGDMVLALNARTVDSPEAFRKLLRRAIVCGEDTVLRVGRGGKVREVRVPASPPGKP